MATKRFQWIYIKDNMVELRDNGIVKVFNNERLEELLNELFDENEQLKKELHKLKLVNEMLSMDFSNSEHELWRENKQLKQSFINLIDKKIEEFQNGDYGDLPCNTIHMFLDLKEELER